MSDFEREVKIALVSNDMTMGDLAKELDISIAYVSDLIKGKRTNQEQIEKIKTFLKLSDTFDGHV